MTQPDLYLIAAVARDGSIGQAGGLPWGRLKLEMRWFAALTMAKRPIDVVHMIVAGYLHPLGLHEDPMNACIMGRRTYESLKGPLPYRQNIVVSRQWMQQFPWDAYPERTHLAATVPIGMDLAHYLHAPNIFFCGGAYVYAEALQLPELRILFITEVDREYPEADAWFRMDIDWKMGQACVARAGSFWQRTLAGPWEEEQGIRFRFTVWEKQS